MERIWGLHGNTVYGPAVGWAAAIFLRLKKGSRTTPALRPKFPVRSDRPTLRPEAGLASGTLLVIRNLPTGLKTL
jgi:hypothetical protein